MQISRITLPSAALPLQRELERPSLEVGWQNEEGACESDSENESLVNSKGPDDLSGVASVGEDVTAERGKWRT
jgi:hypothetical protein